MLNAKKHMKSKSNNNKNKNKKATKRVGLKARAIGLQLMSIRVLLSPF